ncbi:hypothetical protein YC2023_031756 [Brassica napus]
MPNCQFITQQNRIGLSLINSNLIKFHLVRGDDKTDEDAFTVLREKKQGFGILVSSVPKESNAFYSLRDPSEVKKFLKTLVKWRKMEDSTSHLMICSKMVTETNPQFILIVWFSLQIKA